MGHVPKVPVGGIQKGCIDLLCRALCIWCIHPLIEFSILLSVCHIILHIERCVAFPHSFLRSKLIVPTALARNM